LPTDAAVDAAVDVVAENDEAADCRTSDATFSRAIDPEAAAVDATPDIDVDSADADDGAVAVAGAVST
jgi:hypothetical protein